MKDVGMRLKTIQLLEDERKQNPLSGFGNDFVDITPKSQGENR